MYGSASINTFNGGVEVWTYRYSETVPKTQSMLPVVGMFVKDADIHIHELAILFDRSGLVKKYVVRDETR